MMRTMQKRVLMVYARLPAGELFNIRGSQQQQKCSLTIFKISTTTYKYF